MQMSKPLYTVWSYSLFRLKGHTKDIGIHHRIQPEKTITKPAEYLKYSMHCSTSQDIVLFVHFSVPEVRIWQKA